MQTPFGLLKDLDLRDHGTCARILSEDKHQLIEGLVFESCFDQYLLSLTEETGQTFQMVDVDTAVVSLPGQNAGVAAFVWARSRGNGLGRYLQALNSRMPVWFVEFLEGEFVAIKCIDGELRGEKLPLQEVTSVTGRRTGSSFSKIQNEVRDRNRINQSFWGYLSERHGSELGVNVVLSRIFLNWGIQPWFRHVWNVDRVFLSENQLWHFEIKHKFPMDRGGRLSFGINDGELRLIQHLVECGLRSMHTLIVKPHWSKEVGSMYLLNDLKARNRAAVIGREMTKVDIEAALSGNAGRSGADTTYTGRGTVSFRSFPASSFHKFGRLGYDYREVARRIYSHLKDADQEFCQENELRRLRIS